MKKNGKTPMVLGLGLVLLLACGCAAKKMEVTEAPQAPPAEAAAPTATAVPAPAEKYVVQEGDTLWGISDHAGIYADPAQWPLIFRTNRDQIVDPDQIRPGQVLVIQKDRTPDQVAHARQLAEDTPVFRAHVEPRSPLPLDYF